MSEIKIGSIVKYPSDSDIDLVGVVMNITRDTYTGLDIYTVEFNKDHVGVFLLEEIYLAN